MTDALQEYNRKRDFNATPEPSGSAPKGKGQTQSLQFCIQKHDASHLHYDFRLELDGTLKSWAVPKGPSLDPRDRRLAVEVEDHPLDYASFEGHIPEGHYGAGDVIVWDRGIWEPEGDVHQAFEKGRLKFRLQGEKLNGLWNLVRTKMSGSKQQWFLIKSHDDAARDHDQYDVLVAAPDSVVSDRTLTPRPRGKAAQAKPAQVKAPASEKSATPKAGASIGLEGAIAASLAESFSPELATLVDSTPPGDWSYEIKFDGYRILARIDHGEVKLFTRKGNDWTAKLPRQAEALKALKLDSAWLDGEVVVNNDAGVPDFQALQNAFEAERGSLIQYYLFDLMHLNGMDLTRVPLEQRRAALQAVLAQTADDEALRYSASFDESATALLDSACQMGMEGLIGKRVGSPYVSRRSHDWIKLKCKHRQEFVIVGYTEPKGARSGFGALLLGLHDQSSGALRYAGKVGTGFNQVTLQSILAQLQPLEVDKPAMTNPPKGAEARGVHWLRPTLLAEVAYAEITREGVVRHSVFQGLRQDKPAEGITQETPVNTGDLTKDKAPAKPKATANAKAKESTERSPAPRRTKAAKAAVADTHGTQVRITHPDRVIDPSSGTTKIQLAQYYAEVAPWILPHLAQRPVALVRAPDGITGELFFQKHAERLNIPGISTLGSAFSGQPVMVVDNPEALIGAVQMNTIELHTWNATSKDGQHPDRFVLDLDPDPALPWKAMVEATQLTLTVLDELGLKSFLKTSGGKGMHIVVPLKPKDDWEAVKAFSQAIVNHLAHLLPDRFSAVAGPKNRVGKIFVDYLRNTQGATTICAFAARSREGLPVSVPVFREEVAQLKGANQWTIHNIHERLKSMERNDPWAGYAKVRQTLTATMRKKLNMKS